MKLPLKRSGQLIAASFAALLFATTAPATPLSFSETLSGGVVAGSAAANTQHDQACAAWQARAKEIVGNALVYLSCGTRQELSPRTFYEDTDVNGLQQTRYLPPYGNEARSETKLVVDVSGDYDVIEEKIPSTAVTCHPTNLAECLGARQRADATYARDCRAFQENARKNLGARLIYASCGERKTIYAYPITVDNRFVFGWQSMGRIFYRK